MLNQFQGIGNLSADPETRYTQSGKAVANFTVCCEHGWGDNKKTEYVRCVAWEKLAELIGEKMTKGSKCFIQGPMSTRKWEDRDGNTRYTTEINVREFKMLGGGEPKESARPDEQPPMGEDVPF